MSDPPTLPRLTSRHEASVTVAQAVAVATRIEHVGLLRLERAARAYAAFTHGNLIGARYRAREEARDCLLDALAALDVARGQP